MAANTPGGYVGTAPNASYWLFRSEDLNSEFPVEEDYWVTAVEYADSVGVDLINSSVGYGKAFDIAGMNYKHDQTDGITLFMSRGANMAVSRGILVVSSAGNDGAGWVDTPGEAMDVLCAGGIDKNGALWGNTSRGLTADNRMKPDVLAMAANVPVVTRNGVIVTHWSGTSYSSPILCGLAACLWQAYPHLTNMELLDVMRQSGDRFPTPAFGIASMEQAVEIIESTYSKKQVKLNETSLPLTFGEQTTIIPTFSNNITSMDDFVWSTDRSDIINIKENPDKSININAYKEGKAWVKIESADGSMADSCQITIDRQGDGIVRVLGIGNSFTDDAIQAYLHHLAAADGRKLVIARLTIGSSTLEHHIGYATNNTAAYNYWKMDQDGHTTNGGGKTMASTMYNYLKTSKSRAKQTNR